MSQVEEFKGVAEIRRWEAILFDVDDTIIHSSADLWGPAFEFVAGSLAYRAGVDAVEMLEKLEEMNSEEYRRSISGVHPGKYARMAVRLAGEYGIDEPWAKGVMKKAVAMIYLGIPPLIPEAVEAMGICEQAGMKIGLVTHSPRGRIDRMVKGWGLDGKVRVFTESTLKRKDPEVWLRAISGLGITGCEAVAVDDSLGSIRGAGEAGIETLVWVKPKWDEYAKGNVPEGLLKIEHVGQLVQALIASYG